MRSLHGSLIIAICAVGISLVIAEGLLVLSSNVLAPTLVTNYSEAELTSLQLRYSGEMPERYVRGLVGKNWHRLSHDMTWPGQIGKTPEFVIKAHWNNFGCHDLQDYSSDPKRPLLLFLGDSFVESVQVPPDQTFYAQLRQLSLGRHYEIYGCGQSGWSPHDAVRMFQSQTEDATILFDSQLRAVRPQLLIYFIYVGNDLRNEVPEAFDTWRKSTDSCLRDLHSSHYISRFFLGNIARNFLYRTVLTESADLRCQTDEFWPYLPHDVPVLEAGYQKIKESLRQLKNEIQERDGQLRIGIIEPYPIAYGAEKASAILADRSPYYAPTKLHIDAPRQRLNSITQELGIESFYVSDIFRGEARQDHYYPIDRHFSLQGHSSLARGLNSLLANRPVASVE